ncbi:MAG TPA: methyltransferase, partial [Opitutaceae bacterium]|nr:methyltransferase [Opitutaceae bacterium]
MATDARTRFLEQLRSAVHDGTLVKLTLGKHRGADATLQNLFVRPVTLKSGPHLAFVWRHATRDVTKNLVAADA